MEMEMEMKVCALSQVRAKEKGEEAKGGNIKEWYIYHQGGFTKKWLSKVGNMKIESRIEFSHHNWATSINQFGQSGSSSQDPHDWCGLMSLPKPTALFMQLSYRPFSAFALFCRHDATMPLTTQVDA